MFRQLRRRLLQAQDEGGAAEGALDGATPSLYGDEAAEGKSEPPSSSHQQDQTESGLETLPSLNSALSVASSATNSGQGSGSMAHTSLGSSKGTQSGRGSQGAASNKTDGTEEGSVDRVDCVHYGEAGGGAESESTASHSSDEGRAMPHVLRIRSSKSRRPSASTGTSRSEDGGGSATAAAPTGGTASPPGPAGRVTLTPLAEGGALQEDRERMLPPLGRDQRRQDAGRGSAGEL